MGEKVFERDHFSRCIPDLTKWLSDFKDKPNLTFLEIGSLEGRSTCWLMDNILTHPTSKIVCLDLFHGSGEQGIWSDDLYNGLGHDFDIILPTFLENIKEYGDKVEYRIGYSQKLLKDFKEDKVFDFVYIDGSHIASDVLQDIVLSFPLVKVGGLIVFDDYEWEMFDEPLRHPKIAVDAFLNIYANQYDMIHKGHQVAIRKNGRKEGW